MISSVVDDVQDIMKCPICSTRYVLPVILPCKFFEK
jgi:hypothetical protein